MPCLLLYLLRKFRISKLSFHSCRVIHVIKDFILKTCLVLGIKVTVVQMDDSVFIILFDRTGETSVKKLLFQVADWGHQDIHSVHTNYK